MAVWRWDELADPDVLNSLVRARKGEVDERGEGG